MTLKTPAQTTSAKVTPSAKDQKSAAAPKDFFAGIRRSSVGYMCSGAEMPSTSRPLRNT